MHGDSILILTRSWSKSFDSVVKKAVKLNKIKLFISVEPLYDENIILFELSQMALVARTFVFLN